VPGSAAPEGESVPVGSVRFGLPRETPRPAGPTRNPWTSSVRPGPGPAPQAAKNAHGRRLAPPAGPAVVGSRRIPYHRLDSPALAPSSPVWNPRNERPHLPVSPGRRVFPAGAAAGFLLPAPRSRLPRALTPPD